MMNIQDLNPVRPFDQHCRHESCKKRPDCLDIMMVRTLLRFTLLLAKHLAVVRVRGEDGLARFSLGDKASKLLSSRGQGIIFSVIELTKAGREGKVVENPRLSFVDAKCGHPAGFFPKRMWSNLKY